MAQVQLDRDGFVLIPGVVTAALRQRIQVELDGVAHDAYRKRRSGVQFAIRTVPRWAPGICAVLRDPLLTDLVSELTGAAAELVDATLFDKVVGANWRVPAHQDRRVPVARQSDVPGWTGWSTKDGVVFAEPPEAILHNLVALRIHLDDCPRGNGDLEVVPGSHVRRLVTDEITSIPPTSFVACPAVQGDVLAMRPLIVHRSYAAKTPTSRRVLHVVYSGAPWPAPLQQIGT